MSPQCDNCDAHVSDRYFRVRCGNDGKLHGCPDCASPGVRQRKAAGVSSDYNTRTCSAGYLIPKDGGSDD